MHDNEDKHELGDKCTSGRKDKSHPARISKYNIYPKLFYIS